MKDGMKPTDFAPDWVPTFVTSGKVWWLVGLVVVWIVFVKVMMARPPKVRALQLHGRVSGYIGPMGQGKTYTMVRSAILQLKAGADVYTNFWLHLRHEEGRCEPDCELPVIETAGRWGYVASIDEVAMLSGEFNTVRGRRRCVRRFVVMIDEVQDWLSADGTGGKLGPTQRVTIKNLRKRGGDFLWTAQSLGQVHAALKRLTNEFFVCRTKVDWLGRRVFWAACWSAADEIGKEDRRVYTMRHRFDPAVGELYDSSEQVIPDEEYQDERLRRVLVRQLGREAVERARPEQPAQPAPGRLSPRPSTATFGRF